NRALALDRPRDRPRAVVRIESARGTRWPRARWSPRRLTRGRDRRDVADLGRAGALRAVACLGRRTRRTKFARARLCRRHAVGNDRWLGPPLRADGTAGRFAG